MGLGILEDRKLDKVPGMLGCRWLHVISFIQSMQVADDIHFIN